MSWIATRVWKMDRSGNGTYEPLSDKWIGQMLSMHGTHDCMMCGHRRLWEGPSISQRRHMRCGD